MQNENIAEKNAFVLDHNRFQGERGRAYFGVRVTATLLVIFAMTVASGTSAGNLPPPTRVGWSVRVCHTSEKPGGRITFRFGLEQNSANDFPDWTWNKDDPARTGYFTSGAYDEKDFPGGLIGPEKIWIKADNDPHGFNSEVCVMFGGVVKQGMTFDKDESHDVKNDESGNCHC